MQWIIATLAVLTLAVTQAINAALEPTTEAEDEWPK
jgi:hypothetical protein